VSILLERLRSSRYKEKNEHEGEEEQGKWAIRDPHQTSWGPVAAAATHAVVKLSVDVVVVEDLRCLLHGKLRSRKAKTFFRSFSKYG
jgi:hypothetical protein